MDEEIEVDEEVDDQNPTEENEAEEDSVIGEEDDNENDWGHKRPN